MIDKWKVQFNIKKFRLIAYRHKRNDHLSLFWKELQTMKSRA